MFRTLSALSLAILLASTTFAASEGKIITTSKNSAAKPIAFTKTVVVVASPDADLRRRAEGGLARRVRNAVAATTLLPNVGIEDREAMKSAIKASGVDGVLLVRPLSVDEELTMSESEQYYVNYPDLWNYWDTNWMTVTLPGAFSIDKVYTIEIAIFSVKDEQIVWAGRMKAENPKSLRILLDQMVSVGSKELKRQKLL